MKRRLFTAAALLCLAVAVASAVLWVRSHRALASLEERDSISFTHRDPLYWIISEHGRAVLCRQVGRNWDGIELAGFDVLGLNFGGSRGGDGSMLWNLALPYWMIVAPAMVLPLVRAEVWRRDRRRRRREAQRQCPQCGYDLRATPDRCPECGRDAPATDAAHAA